jgi:hypothetical protein
MATVNETVRNAITCYPSLFATRGDALHHLFLVLGNGYTWHKGEIVNKFPEDEGQPWTPERESASFARIDGNADLLRELVDERVQRHQAILSNLDAAVQDLTLTREFVYPQFDGALLFTIPEDVTDDWAAAAEDAKTIAIQGGWKL